MQNLKGTKKFLCEEERRTFYILQLNAFQQWAFNADRKSKLLTGFAVKMSKGLSGLLKTLAPTAQPKNMVKTQLTIQSLLSASKKNRINLSAFILFHINL